MKNQNRKFLLFFLSVVVATVSVTHAVDPSRSHSASDKPAEPGDGGGISRSAPQETGDADPVYWKHFTEAQQTEAVTILKSFADKSINTLKHPLRLQESRYFLLYTDLPQNEAAQYSVLLERMYLKLSELFAVGRGQNLWRGKSLVLVFSKIGDYRLYERMIENNDPGDSIAMTHCFGDGMVHTAFYRHPDAGQFDHLLVHESVHGFLHRYRTPGRVPSWANEGLADEAASELVPDKLRAQLLPGLTRTCLGKHGNNVGDLFTARHIDGWQYPVAETLADWMIHQNRQGYLDFINGIKDGQTWDESLKKNFKTSPEKLIEDYGKAVGVPGLKM